jgi:hypothetical protein
MLMLMLSKVIRMSDQYPLTPEETYVEHLRKGLESSSIIKTRFINFRSKYPDVVVFALEGDDDKIVYAQWVKQIRPDLAYEPFPCGGKKTVRNLKNSLYADLNGLKENVYFFVDKDFDELEGFINSDAVFMTCKYSIENYLVSIDILDDILKNEFPCHARPDLRKKIGDMFQKDYEQFLRVTAELNKRIYVARKLKIELTEEKITEKQKYIANISLGTVDKADASPETVINYQREPNLNDLVKINIEFSKLIPSDHYRGTFAYIFFKAWLELLAKECRNQNSTVFTDVISDERPKNSEFTMNSFASKSKYPPNLPKFLNSIY